MGKHHDYSPSPATRLMDAVRLPPTEIGWAATDTDWSVRRVAADRLPLDQLGWATTDPDVGVRCHAARRLPADQLGWAVNDPGLDVRSVAAARLPPREVPSGVTFSAPEMRLLGAFLTGAADLGLFQMAFDYREGIFRQYAPSLTLGAREDFLAKASRLVDAVRGA
jgi:hypothetical protein